VRGNDNSLRTAYVNHDADAGIHLQSSTFASRPAAGTAGRKWITTDAGSYKLWFDDGTRWHEIGNDAIDVEVIAAETIAKGDVLSITSFNNGLNLAVVSKFTGAAPAFAIAGEDIANGARGYVINTGILLDVDTQSFGASGTVLYPAATGTFTSTKPTSGVYQVSAYVLRQNSNNGVLFVEFSASRIVERSDNTASTIVLRDASGNFAAGTITAGAVTSTGLVTVASLKGTGATTVTNILDEDNMASDSATALATQQSIKAYVDAQVATVDTLAEVLANGNTTGANNIIVSSGQKVTTNTIDETTAAAGVTIDSVLLKDDVVNATDIEVDTLSANNGTLAVTLGSTGVATLAQQPIVSSLTASQAVFTDGSKGLVSNAITGTGNVVMSASPTLTGTVTAATLNATTLGGTLSTAAQTNITSVGTLSGLTVTNPITGSVTGSSGSTTGNAATATTLQTARNINGVSFNGSADITVTAAAGTLSGATLASGVTASSLTSVGTLASLAVTGDLTVDTSTLKVDAANNRVGIGTASPLVPFDVNVATTIRENLTVTKTSSDTRVLVTAAGVANTVVGFNNSGGTSSGMVNNVGYVNVLQAYPLVFGNDSTERMRIDASGNVGIGVTPSAWEAGKAIQFGTYGAVSSALASGVNTQLTNNIYYDGDDYRYIAGQEASMVQLVEDKIIFFNATSGSGGSVLSFTERARITAGGEFAVNNTNPAGFNAQLLSVSTSASKYAGVFYGNASANDGQAALQVAKSSATNTSSQVLVEFYINAFNTASGRIVADGASAAAFASFSDERLKENIAELPSQLDNILALRPVEFDFKDGSGHQIGFIAQEFRDVYPDAVTGDGDEMLTIVGWNKTEARLVKALQEAMARIESLEARLDALQF
jgi:hypothetical protein